MYDRWGLHMPPTPITPISLNSVAALNDVIETNWFCVLSEQVSVNRLHYIVTAKTGLSLEFNNIATMLEPLLAPSYAQLVCNIASFAGLSLRNFYPYTRRTLYSWVKDIRPGTGGPDPLPRQVAGMFTKQTIMPRQAGRGRFYAPFPCLTDTDVPKDRPNAGYMVRLGLMAGAVLAVRTLAVGADSVTLSPIVMSKSSPSQSFGIGNCVAKQLWATHRSRGDFGRPNQLPPALQ
jgi:hypothetical protein